MGSSSPWIRGHAFGIDRKYYYWYNDLGVSCLHTVCRSKEIMTIFHIWANFYVFPWFFPYIFRPLFFNYNVVCGSNIREDKIDESYTLFCKITPLVKKALRNQMHKCVVKHTTAYCCVLHYNWRNRYPTIITTQATTFKPQLLNPTPPTNINRYWPLQICSKQSSVVYTPKWIMWSYPC